MNDKYQDKLTLSNDFHNTETVVMVKDGIISAGSMKRAKKKLCGMKDCQCGGLRGEQAVVLEELHRFPFVGAYQVSCK